MLTLYLCPKRRPQYQPSVEQVHEWLTSAIQGQLLMVSESQLDVPPTSFTPGLGVAQLFNNDARDALLPAELTFETLELCRASTPALLPPEMTEREQYCPQCGDEVTTEALNVALNKLEFISLERSTIFCLSCQDELTIKTLEFEPLSAFATFWIRLDEVGSSRLNPALWRDWETRLGCSLELLLDQRETDLEEISSARRESEFWRNLESDNDVFAVGEIDALDTYERNSYRRLRHQRRTQSHKRGRKRSSRGRSPNRINKRNFDHEQ